MIKCDKGQIELSGNIPMIHAELAALIEGIYNSTKQKCGDDLAKKLIEKDFCLAFMSEEECEYEKTEMQKKMSDALFQLMEKLFKNY